MYEESIRVPLLIVDPRLPRELRGQKVEALTLNIDFAPTILDLAGQKAPARMQGRSLLPLMRAGPPAHWRSDFLYEHHFGPKIIPPSEGVRTDLWKYLRWTGVDPVVEELYDLQADPREEHNLAGEAAHAETLARLRKRWEELGRQLK
jgi:arylsulfatase A-like enzyme